ncbi:MAG: hypothetical protein QF496_01120 [Dehalococcoidia bacterium]|jgi:hypothetical protein|nr:hypothetical protein [Dehalococcoidia bacterium]
MIINLVFGIIIGSVMSLFTIGHLSVSMVTDEKLSKLFLNKNFKSNKFLIAVLIIHFFNLILGLAFSLLFYFIFDDFIQLTITLLIIFGGIILVLILKPFWKHVFLETAVFILLYIWLMPLISSIL